MAEGFRLTSELVPETSWDRNLRKQLPKRTWDKIRKQAIADAKEKCAICGAVRPLYCHEVWEYDDANLIQRLAGFTALCNLCHHVKHLGMAGILAYEGRLDFERVINHFMAVNGCDRRAFDAYHSQVFAIWQERSKHEWAIDLGEYAALINPPARQAELGI
jgi:hypothetical protein